jgi:hypothetical protein
MKRYTDFYGCSAYVKPVPNGFRLTIHTLSGKKITDKVYKTERGVKIAMGKLSDGWEERRKIN